MKTKEEIISKYMHKYKGIYVVSETMALVAMEEYAEQQVKLCNKPQIILSLPEQDEIDEQIDKYSFRVPYDGSNNFYDDVALKHYKAGIEWLLNRIKGNKV